MNETLKKKAFEVLKSKGVMSQILRHDEFNNEEDGEFGYVFELKNGQFGKIVINDNYRVVIFK